MSSPYLLRQRRSLTRAQHDVSEQRKLYSMTGNGDGHDSVHENDQTDAVAPANAMPDRTV